MNVVILSQELADEAKEKIESKLPEIESDGQEIHSRYQTTEPLQLNTTLHKKYTNMMKHLQESIDNWAKHAQEHNEFDEEMNECQKALEDAQQFDETVCNHAFKLQSQLLLEDRVKVSQHADNTVPYACLNLLTI